MITPFVVSLLYYFFLKDNGLFCYGATVLLDGRLLPHLASFMHDRKIQLPAGSVSHSRPCVSYSGSEAMTPQRREETGLRVKTKATGSYNRGLL